MNCHKNKKHSPIKHMLMMVLCCGLPMLLVSLIPLIGVNSSAKAFLGGIAPFICPLMMLIMIPMMIKGMKQGGCCGTKKETNEE